MKNTLAISLSASTKVFLSIAGSDMPAEAKGRLITVASKMMENPDSVTKDEFSAIEGGEEIFEAISLAVIRSRRARAAAAARRRVAEPQVEIPAVAAEAVGVERVVARPDRHPRLKIKCRYKTGSRHKAVTQYRSRYSRCP